MHSDHICQIIPKSCTEIIELLGSDKKLSICVLCIELLLCSNLHASINSFTFIFVIFKYPEARHVISYSYLYIIIKLIVRIIVWVITLKKCVYLTNNNFDKYFGTGYVILKYFVI